MLQKLVYRSFTIVLLFSIFACNKEDDFKVDYKYDYFPVDSAHYVIYDVDSVTYDDFFDPPRVDTTTFQLKEVVESIFSDNSGRPTARIERYRRDTDQDEWVITGAWTATLTASAAERMEDNLRFIKLLFPPKTDVSWQGNAYINTNEGATQYLDGWEYRVSELDVAKTINGLSFTSTLTVDQHDDETLIEKIYGTETYAKGVGLVYKELWHLEKQNVTAPWTEAERGFIYTMKVKDYKK